MRRFRVGTHQPDIFPIKNDMKQGDYLFLVHLNFDLAYAISRVQVDNEGLKLNDTHQLLVYSDAVNLLAPELFF